MKLNIMKHFIKILLLLCICAGGASAQVIWKYVEVPREIFLPVIAVQPNCPVRFEDVHFVRLIDGGGVSSYRIRNIGKKPIRGVTVASSNGTKNGYYNNGNVLILPGKLMPEPVAICPECVKEEIVPLTDELREKLNLKGPLQGVLLLMIVEVKFTDGTEYKDEKTFKAMTEYFDELHKAVYEQKQRAAKQP